MQKGTNQWQQHYKENCSGGLISSSNCKDDYKRKCSKEFFCNSFGQDGTERLEIASYVCRPKQVAESADALHWGRPPREEVALGQVEAIGSS